MTLPDERYRAIVQTEKFLWELCDSSKTPRVPMKIRAGARGLLRHYPNKWDLDQISRAAPEVVAEKMEPVTRLMAQYEESKKND